MNCQYTRQTSSTKHRIRDECHHVYGVEFLCSFTCLDQWLVVMLISWKRCHLHFWHHLKDHWKKCSCNDAFHVGSGKTQWTEAFDQQYQVVLRDRSQLLKKINVLGKLTQNSDPKCPSLCTTWVFFHKKFGDGQSPRGGNGQSSRVFISYCMLHS